MAQDGADLADSWRQLCRAKFQDAVETGASRPFVMPFHLLAVWIVPTLYLAIPHKNRPWLYRARWLVLAFIVVFNFQIIAGVSSRNFAAAYGVCWVLLCLSLYGAGLMAAWGTIWSFTLLVWTKPQWDARRVDIRRKQTNNCEGPKTLHDSSNTSRLPISPNGSDKTNGERPPSLGGRSSARAEDNIEGDSSNQVGQHNSQHIDVIKKVRDGTSSSTLRERTQRPKSLSIDPTTNTKGQTGTQLTNGAVAGPEQELEYYWQDFPDDGSFLTRISWAFDIVSTFRMTGWNWALHCLPPYHPPPYTPEGRQLPLSSLPNRSKQGYTRILSRREFLVDRLFRVIIPGYLVLDLCAVLMMRDPYFVLGPDRNHEHDALAPLLPPDAADAHPATLLLITLRRTALSLVGVLSALHFVLNIGALLLCFLLRPVLGFRTDPWHLPSIYGSFAQVLDRGLAGFWGGWWHQTFRFAFEAPARYLIAWRRKRQRQEGRRAEENTPSERFILSFCAFLQSGFLHGAASYTSVPETKWWLPPLFFALAGLGITLQQRLASALRPQISQLPRWTRRLGNLTFVLVWMQATSWLLVDDFGRCGLWLYEPVPFSPLRALGYGHGPAGGPGHAAWRYDADFMPRWHTGRRWWESGVSI